MVSVSPFWSHTFRLRPNKVMSEINGELALERDVCAILPLRALINVSPFWLALVYIPLTQGSLKI